MGFADLEKRAFFSLSGNIVSFFCNSSEDDEVVLKPDNENNDEGMYEMPKALKAPRNLGLVKK